MRPRLRHPEFLIGGPADKRAVVAGDAPRVGELHEAGLLRIAQSALVSREEFVPTGRSHQQPFKCADGLRHVVVRYRIALTRERLFEQVHIFRHRLQHSNDGRLARHRHFDRVQHRPFGLLLHVLRAPIPKLGHVQSGVINRRGVPVALLPLETAGCRLIIDAILVQHVAGIAGQVLALRNPVLEVEHTAEFHLGLGRGVVRRLHGLRERSKRPQPRLGDVYCVKGGGRHEWDKEESRNHAVLSVELEPISLDAEGQGW